MLLRYSIIAIKRFDAVAVRGQRDLLHWRMRNTPPNRSVLVSAEEKVDGLCLCGFSGPDGRKQPTPSKPHLWERSTRAALPVQMGSPTRLTAAWAPCRMPDGAK